MSPANNAAAGAAADPADHDASSRTPTPAEQGGADWTAAVGQVRAASGWVVKAFAAIAVALVGTSPLLVNLGNLGFNTRGIIAVAGAAIALSAIGLIISWATDVNLTEITDVVDLTTAHPDDATRDLLARISHSPRGREIYLGGKGSVDALLDFRARTIKTYEQQLGLQAMMTGEADRTAIKGLIDGTMATLDHVDGLIRNLQGWVTYRRVRERYEDRRKPTMIAGGVAVIGIVLWLAGLSIDISGTSSPAPSASSAPSQGTLGTLKWAQTPQVADLRRQLGLDAATCATATVSEAGGAGDAINPWQVTVLPNQNCVPPADLGSFTVDRRFATFTALPTGRSATVTVKSSGSRLNDSVWLIIVISAGALVGAVGFRAAASRRR